MKIISDITLRDFQTWAGATETKDKILEENKGEEFESLVDEMFPEGLTDTQLNDYLWFDEESIYESLGIVEESTE